MNLAKQNTAKLFLVGPILDADGVAVTGALTATDVLKVTKNGTVGAADAQDTMAHNHTGHYVVTTDGGDFDTLGEVEFSLNSGTNAMAPVKFQVVTANVYDSLCSTDVLQVDLLQVLGTALTEGAGGGKFAGSMVKFFNVATPTGTINSLPDAVAGAASGLAIVGSSMVVPDSQKVDVNTIKTKAVTVDAGGTTFPASIHASGAAVAKSPATLAAGDVTGNLPADVKQVETVDATDAITAAAKAALLDVAYEAV